MLRRRRHGGGTSSFRNRDCVEKSARRVTEILSVLSRYGLADWLAGLNYEWLQGRLVSANGMKLGKLTHEEWRRLQQRARPTLKELLLAPEPRFEMEIPDRHRWRWRAAPKLK